MLLPSKGSTFKVRVVVRGIEVFGYGIGHLKLPHGTFPIVGANALQIITAGSGDGYSLSKVCAKQMTGGFKKIYRSGVLP